VRIDTAAPTRRVVLDAGSWVDVTPGWLDGADELYAHLSHAVPWQQSRLWRYERWVDEPRVGAAFRVGRAPAPVLVDATKVLRARYGVDLESFALAWYRDGSDGQAFHRDRDLRYCEDTIVALLTLGARRPWLLRPRSRRDKWTAEAQGAVRDLAPGPGELIVLGGRAQADWEHSVPQVRGAAAGTFGRISVQWRWTSRRGRPEVGASYRAPRHFSS
jgi:alkylated DNA repair dioxygenase AlkB